MQPEDAERLFDALDAAAEVTGKDLTPEGKEMYFRTLEDQLIEDVERAVYHHMRNTDAGAFMPKPADILRHIEGDSESAALSAWHKVLQALERVGSGQSVVFDDPAIHACIDQMGGWMELGRRVTEKEEPFFRQQFVKLYRAKRGDPGRYPAKLIGYIEAQNRRDGFGDRVDPPRLIGNQDKAQRVLANGMSGNTLPISEAPASLESQAARVGQETKQLETQTDELSAG